MDCHSNAENAAGTYKRAWRHHPLGARVANTGEALTILPRLDNVGSNTASDHTAVPVKVFDQIPDAGKQPKIPVRIDGASASHEMIELIFAAGHSRGRMA